jgi:hypothetical protein
MPGPKTFILSALVLATSATAFGADPEYFPLAVGNSWVYKVTEGRIPDVQVVEVTGTASLDGRSYFSVMFLGREVFLRVSSDGTLYEYDSPAKREKVWIAFGSEAGQAFPTEIDNCTKTAKIESKVARYTGSIGNFTNALQLSFSQSCADAGFQSETFLPYVGMVQHVADNVAGARTYALIYSRTGVTEVTTSEIRFSLSLDSAVYPVGTKTPVEMISRLTLRNTTPDPITLQFSSGQSSADKLFAQVIRNEKFGPGERNYVIQVPLPSLPAGKYVVDAYVTTKPITYTASAAFEYRVAP